MDLRTVAIEELDLGVRAYNFAKRNNVDTCQDLYDLAIAEVNSWRSGYTVDGCIGLSAYMELAEAQDYLHKCVQDYLNDI